MLRRTHNPLQQVIYPPRGPAARTWFFMHNGRHALTPVQYNTLIADFTTMVIANHKEVTVPGWEAGSNWSALPWDIIWRQPARKNWNRARLMYGLMAQDAFIQHPDWWWTGSTVYAGRDVPNAYYFKDNGVGPNIYDNLAIIREQHE